MPRRKAHTSRSGIIVRAAVVSQNIGGSLRDVYSTPSPVPTRACVITVGMARASELAAARPARRRPRVARHRQRRADHLRPARQAQQALDLAAVALGALDRLAVVDQLLEGVLAALAGK